MVGDFECLDEAGNLVPFVKRDWKVEVRRLLVRELPMLSNADVDEIIATVEPMVKAKLEAKLEAKGNADIH